MPIYPYSFTMPPVNKQDIPSDGVVGEFLGISAGGVLDWLPVAGGGGGGDLLAANNLSELTATAGTARTNLGLGTGDSPTFANLTLTSPSLSSSAPVTISQTWNGTGSTVFKALVVNATTPGTTSSSSSLLLDLQVGGVSQFSVNKIGQASALFSISSQYLSITQNASIASDAGALVFGATSSVWLRRDGADNTLALRNSTAAQTFNVYGTYTSGTSYERLTLSAPSAANAIIGTNKGSGGGTARGLSIQTDGATAIDIGTTGNIGIGMTAGSSKLSVTGSVDVTLLRTGFYVQAGSAFLFGTGGSADVGFSRTSAGVAEVNSSTAGAYRDLRVRSVIQQPPATITPDTNGDLVVEATSNTTLTFKLKGTDGTVRTGTITLA